MVCVQCLNVSLFFPLTVAVKEAAVQRRHNLYRDSIVLTSSDPNLHLLGDNPAIDWAGEYGTGQEEVETGDSTGGAAQRRRRMKQVVSMIQLDGSPILESRLDIPMVDSIPEEGVDQPEEGVDQDTDAPSSPERVHQEPAKVNGTSLKGKRKAPPPPVQPENIPSPALTNGSVLEGEPATILSEAPEIQTKISEDLPQEDECAMKSPEAKSFLHDPESTASAIESAIREIDNAVQGEDSEPAGGSVLEAVTEVSPSSQDSVPFSKKEESLKPIQQEALAPTAFSQEESTPSSLEEVSSSLSTQTGVAATPVAKEEIPTPTTLDSKQIPAAIPTEMPKAIPTALETEQVPVPGPMPGELESASVVRPELEQATVDLDSLSPPHDNSGFQSLTSEAVKKDAAPSTEGPEAVEVVPEAGGDGVTGVQ